MLVDKMIPLILGAAATVGAQAADYASPKSFGVGRSQIVISSSQETGSGSCHCTVVLGSCSVTKANSADVDVESFPELLNYEMSGTYAYPAASINFFWITGDPVSPQCHC